MKKNKIVSVIIPVYNVEKYIMKCLQSIMNQTYKDLEIIVVDDCGTDNSIAIVLEIAKKDDRIKFLSYSENRGASFARNYGLEQASGDYVYFIDSDDFIDLNYIELMMENIGNFDIIQNNNWIEYNEGLESKINNKLSNTKKLKNICYSNQISPNIWNKIYKKSFLKENNIKFPQEIKIGEDLYFNLFCFSLTQNIKYVYLNANYFYRQTNSSILKRMKKDNDILKTFNLLYELSNKNALNSIILPLFHLRQHLNESKNKNKMFLELKIFFIKIKTKIEENENFYKKKDLRFFYCVLNSRNFYFYKLKFMIKKLLTI